MQSNRNASLKPGLECRFRRRPPAEEAEENDLSQVAGSRPPPDCRPSAMRRNRYVAGPPQSSAYPDTLMIPNHSRPPVPGCRVPVVAARTPLTGQPVRECAATEIAMATRARTTFRGPTLGELPADGGMISVRARPSAGPGTGSDTDPFGGDSAIRVKSDDRPRPLTTLATGTTIAGRTSSAFRREPASHHAGVHAHAEVPASDNVPAVPTVNGFARPWAGVTPSGWAGCSPYAPIRARQDRGPDLAYRFGVSDTAVRRSADRRSSRRWRRPAGSGPCAVRRRALRVDFVPRRLRVAA